MKFGPPFLKLDHALNCFTLVDGTEICDKNSEAVKFLIFPIFVKESTELIKINGCAHITFEISAVK